MKTLGQLSPRLSGPVGYLLAGSTLLAYVILALLPFRWNPPHWIDNGVDLGGDIPIRFPSPGLLQTTSPPPWLDKAIQNGALEVHIRLRPGIRFQPGPAGIFTISTSNHLRNLSIEQKNEDLLVRLRTVDGPFDGGPPYTIPGALTVSEWRNIDLVILPGAFSLRIDDELALSSYLPERALMSWDRDFLISLGNELTGRRPWSGEVARITITAGGLEIDYSRRGALDAPSRYWVGPKLRPINSIAYMARDPSLIRDAVLNFSGFVLLGFLFALARGRRSFLFSVAICAVSSFGVEVAQFCFDPRDPSLVDWFLNVNGAALGAFPIRYLRRRPA